MCVARIHPLAQEFMEYGSAEYFREMVQWCWICSVSMKAEGGGVRSSGRNDDAGSWWRSKGKKKLAGTYADNCVTDPAGHAILPWYHLQSPKEFPDVLVVGFGRGHEPRRTCQRKKYQDCYKSFCEQRCVHQECRSPNELYRTD